MQFGGVLYGEESLSFVGRDKELEVMHRHIAGERKWLHIHGQSGIGKSSLLRRFTSELEGRDCFLIDGNRGIMHKEDVAGQLAEQLWGGERISTEQKNDDFIKNGLNDAIQSGLNIVLIFDAFEKMRAVEEWLSVWLRQLNKDVKIISAGRHPLTGGWLRNGWMSLTDSIQLSALTPFDVKQYAFNRGISDNKAQSQLIRFSGGIPLAMTLAAEVLIRGNKSNRFDRNEQYRLISILMDELLSELPQSIAHLLEAASVYWRFNEERMAVLLDDGIIKEFRKLIQLPFVVLVEGGWMLHDAVRDWVQEDLILRKPQAYEQMRRKALQQIRMEERVNPQLRNKLRMDKLFLHEHPIVRNTCFLGYMDDVEVRECRECDLPAIQSLYHRFLQHALPFLPGERHLEGIIRPVWETDPSSFFTLWKQNELIAFYGMIPLHDQMLKVLRNEPLLQPLFHEWKPISNAYFLSVIGIEPELEGQTGACVTNILINHFSVADWIIDFTCLKEWFPVFELLGFERAAWADATTNSGTEYRAFTLDLAEEDFLAKFDRLLTSNLTEETFAHTDPAKGIQDLKQILKEWASLPRNLSLCDSYNRLFPHRILAEVSVQDLGSSIQQDLLRAINQLSAGDDRDAILGRLLRYTYTQGIRPQTLVAERLNLSPASYYRYLNKSVERLYELLNGEEK